MPRQLALLLCTAFVLFLLRLERRESSGVSAAAWIPTLWMLAIASKPLGIWFGSAGQAESGSPLDRFMLISLAIAGVAVLARRRYDWAGALRGQGWLLALFAYMLVSTAWSDITLIAVRRWGREVIVLIMALVTMSETEPRRALESVLRRTSYVLVPFSLMLIKYYPRLGVEYGRWSGLQMWVGVTVHKNTLGRLCLISAMFLFWALYRRWRERQDTSATPRSPVWADASVLVVTLFLLKGPENAYSATSIGTIAVGMAAFMGLAWLRSRQLLVPQFGLLAVLVLLIGLGTATPFLGGADLATVSTTMGRDETLTGRTETWAELVPVATRQQPLGYGFGSFWTTTRRDFYEMSNGHNGYLDILLELGAVGLAFFTAWLLSFGQKLHGVLKEKSDWAILAICFLLMAVVYNTTESAFNSMTEQMTAVVVLASLVVPYEPVLGPKRSHLRLRLHVPPQRLVGTPPAQSGPSTHRRPLRPVDRGGGQRRRWTRARHRDPGPGGDAP